MPKLTQNAWGSAASLFALVTFSRHAEPKFGYHLLSNISKIAEKKVPNKNFKHELVNEIRAALLFSGLKKIELQKRMHTSKSELVRIFDQENNALTLKTLISLANALGKKLKISFDEP